MKIIKAHFEIFNVEMINKGFRIVLQVLKILYARFSKIFGKPILKL